MIGSALTPRACASRATALASASLARALTITWQPSRANCNTVARPILRPEPVTNATLPSSLPIDSSPISPSCPVHDELCRKPPGGTSDDRRPRASPSAIAVGDDDLHAIAREDRRRALDRHPRGIDIDRLRLQHG